MADIDLARIKRNVAKMAAQNAPEEDIDGYIASEGTSIDAIRAFKPAPISASESTATKDYGLEVVAPPSGDPGALGTSVMAGGNALLGNFGNELGAALFSPIEIGIGAYTGEDDGKGIMERIYDGYNRGLRKRDDLMAYAEGKHPLAATAGMVAGSVGAGSALAKAGLSVAANTAARGGSLAKIAGGSLIDGAVLGGVTAAGDGNGLEERISNGVKGAASGAALGLATPYVAAGVGSAVKPISNMVLSRLAPESFANQAMATALKRSGMSPDAIVRELEDAQTAGQGMYTLADAMGNSGQRMLNVATRTPNDARQGVVEALGRRQSDAGRRVASALTDASGTPMTAEEYTTALQNLRATEARMNYGPVMTETTPIDVNGAVGAANSRISPLADQFARSRGSVPTDLAVRAPIEAGESQIRDPIREAVRTARSYLASDGLTVTNVGQAFRAKTNIDQMISNAVENGRGGEVEALMPIQQALDDALARTSSNYAGARDAYSAASARVDAVTTGRNMAKPRTRTDDNLLRFEQLPDDASREAARVGYFEPKIVDAERSTGQMSNAARPFLSDSMRREIPAFAAPGTADDVTARLAREQRMYETTAVATGGSKTSDNLADMEDFAQFDPAVLSRLFRKDFSGAALQAFMKVVDEAKGLPPRVVERVAQGLMETNPEAARRVLSAATTKALNNQGRRAVVLNVLNSLAAPAVGRAATP